MILIKIRICHMHYLDWDSYFSSLTGWFDGEREAKLNPNFTEPELKFLPYASYVYQN